MALRENLFADRGVKKEPVVEEESGQVGEENEEEEEEEEQGEKYYSVEQEFNSKLSLLDLPSRKEITL